jgi:uncharacterized membrane protein YfcA
VPLLADVLSGFANISLAQLALVAFVTLFASVIGGVAGYGTGALMPLVLVPMVGAEPVVPIIAISALFTNTGRIAAFFTNIDGRRALIVIAGAALTCVLGAWAYTRLSGAGAALVIGTMLILSVPLRRFARRKALTLNDGGLAVGAAGFGLVVGGTTGSGAILLSLLMAAGLEGAAVIATDAAISVAVGIVKVATFGVAGAVTPQVVAFGLLIGAIAFPGGFLAKALLQRLPITVHTALLDGVIILGGVVMIIAAVKQSWT